MGGSRSLTVVEIKLPPSGPEFKIKTKKYHMLQFLSTDHWMMGSNFSAISSNKYNYIP